VSRGRMSRCSRADALARLEQARRFLEGAELVHGEGSAYGSVAVSLAVLAGIAASDAACCAVLGERPRGQNHREAVGIVERVQPGGDDAGKALRRLLDQKDKAEYGFGDVGAPAVRSALRQAESLVRFAERALRQ
jgi:hypothetical protein